MSGETSRRFNKPRCHVGNVHSGDNYGHHLEVWCFILWSPFSTLGQVPNGAYTATTRLSRKSSNCEGVWPSLSSNRKVRLRSKWIGAVSIFVDIVVELTNTVLTTKFANIDTAPIHLLLSLTFLLNDDEGDTPSQLLDFLERRVVGVGAIRNLSKRAKW